jgi:hypothetical protein
MKIGISYPLKLLKILRPKNHQIGLMKLRFQIQVMLNQKIGMIFLNILKTLLLQNQKTGTLLVMVNGKLPLLKILNTKENGNQK